MNRLAAATYLCLAESARETLLSKSPVSSVTGTGDDVVEDLERSRLERKPRKRLRSERFCSGGFIEDSSATCDSLRGRMKVDCKRGGGVATGPSAACSCC